MKLASVAFRAPSRIVTNDEILAMIREHSGDIYDGKIDRMLHEVKVRKFGGWLTIIKMVEKERYERLKILSDFPT